MRLALFDLPDFSFIQPVQAINQLVDFGFLFANHHPFQYQCRVRIDDALSQRGYIGGT